MLEAPPFHKIRLQAKAGARSSLRDTGCCGPCNRMALHVLARRLLSSSTLEHGLRIADTSVKAFLHTFEGKSRD